VTQKANFLLKSEKYYGLGVVTADPSPRTDHYWSQIVPYDANIKLKDVNSKSFPMNFG